MPALPGARDSQVERYAFVDHVRSRKIFTQENIFLHLKSSISIRLPHLEFMNNKQYYVTLPDKAQEGPYDEKDLITRYQAGKYPKGTLVWQEGMDSWILIETMMSNVERITMMRGELPIANRTHLLSLLLFLRHRLRFLIISRKSIM